MVSKLHNKFRQRATNVKAQGFWPKVSNIQDGDGDGDATIASQQAKDSNKEDKLTYFEYSKYYEFLVQRMNEKQKKQSPIGGKKMQKII